MSYLTRLAQQTGLMPLAPPLRAQPAPEPLEIVEEVPAPPTGLPGEGVLEARAETPVKADDMPVETPAPFDPPVIREETRVEPAPKPLTEEAEHNSAAPPRDVHPASPEAASPDQPASPPAQERAENGPIELRHVLEWVAQNDRPAPPDGRRAGIGQGSAEAGDRPPSLDVSQGTPAPPPEVPVAAAMPPDAPTDVSGGVPEIEIQTDFQTPPMPDVSAARPVTEPAPPEPAPRITEERVDISIGAIRVDVTPPPAAPAPIVAAPAPTPARAPAAPSLTSRLRRRYVRI